MEQILFWTIIAIIVANYVLSMFLEFLNGQNWKNEVPDRLKDFYDNEKYKKSQAYDKANKKISVITSSLTTLIIIVLIVTGGFAILDQWVSSFTTHPIMSSLLFFAVLFLASGIVGLPFSIYGTFVIEEKFGFNKTSPITFILDRLKGLVMTVILGGGLLYLIMLIYHEYPEWFWLMAWATVSIVSIFFTLFYTSLIVPLFNKLKRLEDGELREAISSYANSVAFPIKNIYVMDGSKRSAKANAYFSGIGPKKSIVLFDTLIEKHTTSELVSILAHEVGHYKKKHVSKGMALSLLQTGIIFLVLGWALSEPSLSGALGSEVHNFHLALLSFGILFTPVSAITRTFMNVFSRKNEFEADRYAAQTYSAKELQAALKKLSVDHLSNLEPHKSYVFFYYSHPPVLQRLASLDKHL